MQTYNLAAPALSLADQLVLRSTLRLLPDAHWRHVDSTQAADVRLVHTDQADERGHMTPRADAVGRPLTVWLAPPRSAPSVFGRTMTLPLRAREVLTQLRQLETSLSTLGPSPVPPVPANGISAEAKQSTPAAVLRLLCDDASFAGGKSIAVKIDSSVIVIDSQATSSASKALRWRSWTFTDIAQICQKIAQGAPLSIDAETGERHALVGEPSCSGPLRQLVWAIAIHERNPVNAASVDASARFGLTRWPDFGALPGHPQQLRLAATISRARLTAQQLALRTGVPIGEVTAFLNACHWSNFLLMNVEPDRTAVGSQEAEPIPLSRVSAPRQPGFASLLRNIRTALRFDLGEK